jgi:hypothetical protein
MNLEACLKSARNAKQIEKKSNGNRYPEAALLASSLWFKAGRTSQIPLTRLNKESIMKRIHQWLAALVVVAFVSVVLAKPPAVVPSYSAGYPKTGTNAGGILVKGTTMLGAGWTATGAGLISVWPKAGGDITTKALTVNKITANWGDDGAGKWIEVEIIAPTSGEEYYVTVQITAKDGVGNMKTGATTPVVVKSK